MLVLSKLISKSFIQTELYKALNLQAYFDKIPIKEVF